MAENAPQTTHRALAPLRDLISKTVAWVSYAMDAGGYQFVYIEFDDGTKLRISEISQTGEMAVSIDDAVIAKPVHE